MFDKTVHRERVFQVSFKAGVEAAYEREKKARTEEQETRLAVRNKNICEMPKFEHKFLTLAQLKKRVLGRRFAKRDK
jgi:hypothetical protein